MKEISKGDVFVLPVKNVTQLMINHYADAAEDHNPLHVDPDFAKTTRFGGTIAHGMLSVAFIQELMVRTFGRKVTKVVPVEDSEDKILVRMQVVCLNGKQEKVIKGTTEVMVS